MAPAPDDDLDWLYGRDQKKSTQPEPTRVIPTSPGGADGPGAGSRPTGNPPTASHPAVPVNPAGHPSTPGYGYGPPPVAAPPSAAWPGGRGPNGPGGPPAAPPAPTPPKKRHPVRILFGVLAVVILLMIIGLVAVPIYAWSQVQRVDEAPSGQRPANQPGTTFLLVGSDSRAGLTKAERKKLGTGNTAGQRTDTIMILYIPTAGEPALISVPRDSYLPIPGHGSNKVNAAYSLGGPKLLVKTIEQNTGLRMDGYLEIGFGGFVNVIDAVGGINMCLPKAIKDKDSHINLPKGCQTLNGTNALGYVRMRKADPLGDLGRVQRQRAMLAAVAKKGASLGTVLNPVRYWQLNKAAAQSVALGKTTSFWQMLRLALAMKTVSGGGGLTLTVPVSNSAASTPAGSAVLWDNKAASAMFSEIIRGDTSKLAKYAK
jgi:LCP family protein required for cell wall assembly